MRHLPRHLPLLVSLLLYPVLLLAFVGCGKPQVQDERSGAGSGLGADAKRKPGQTGETANGGEADGGEELDCSGIMLHEGQETCDQDDIDAADDPAGTGDAGAADAADTEGGDDAGEMPPPAPAPVPTTPPEDPNVVVFRIKAGTGTAPWNDEAAPVQVKMGQTLRIVNDDTVRHRLHTNGAPCGHGANFDPGASYDCVVTRAYDSANTPGGMYDHIAGQTARFYVKTSP